MHNTRCGTFDSFASFMSPQKSSKHKFAPKKPISGDRLTTSDVCLVHFKWCGMAKWRKLGNRVMVTFVFFLVGKTLLKTLLWVTEHVTLERQATPSPLVINLMSVVRQIMTLIIESSNQKLTQACFQRWRRKNKNLIKKIAKGRNT